MDSNIDDTLEDEEASDMKLLEQQPTDTSGPESTSSRVSGSKVGLDLVPGEAKRLRFAVSFFLCCCVTCEMGFLGVDLDLAAGFDAAGMVDESAAVDAADATCRAEVQATWFSK